MTPHTHVSQKANNFSRLYDRKYSIDIATDQAQVSRLTMTWHLVTIRVNKHHRFNN
jgi:hypothetical protein